MITTHRMAVFLTAAACITFAGENALAQRGPTAHGSLDAVTALPAAPTVAAATAPAAALPAGHVPVPGAMVHPEAMNGPKTGALRVVFTQGTKGAPALNKDEVRIDLLVKGVSAKTIRTTIDDKGLIEIHDLPLDPPFQPVVTVTHGGADEQMVGPPMHKYQPAVEMDMSIFETTTQKPAWTIGLRDVEMQALDVNGATMLRVTEMLGGYNPTDRAWTGERVGDASQTMAITLPAAAKNVQFGPGFAEAGAKVLNNTIIRGKTMLPGSTQYVFAYDLPVTDGHATLTFTSPADTSLFAVYVPDAFKTEQVQGLDGGTASGTHATDNFHLLKAKTVKAGDVASVELSDVKVPPPAATKPAETLDQTTDLHLAEPGTASKPKP